MSRIAECSHPQFDESGSEDESGPSRQPLVTRTSCWRTCTFIGIKEDGLELLFADAGKIDQQWRCAVKGCTGGSSRKWGEEERSPSKNLAELLRRHPAPSNGQKHMNSWRSETKKADDKNQSKHTCHPINQRVQGRNSRCGIAKHTAEQANVPGTNAGG